MITLYVPGIKTGASLTLRSRRTYEGYAIVKGLLYGLTIAKAPFLSQVNSHGVCFEQVALEHVFF